MTSSVYSTITLYSGGPRPGWTVDNFYAFFCCPSQLKQEQGQLFFFVVDCQ